MGKTYSQVSHSKRAKLDKRNKARKTKHASIDVFTSRKDK